MDMCQGEAVHNGVPLNHSLEHVFFTGKQLAWACHKASVLAVAAEDGPYKGSLMELFGPQRPTNHCEYGDRYCTKYCKDWHTSG